MTAKGQTSAPFSVRDERVQQLLASSANGFAATVQAARQLRSLDVAWPSSARVHVLANYTLNSLTPLLEVACYRLGVAATITISDPSRYELDTLDPSDALPVPFAPDVVLIAVWLDDLPLAFDASGALQPDRLWEHLVTLVQRLRKTATATIAITTVLPALHTAGFPDQLSAVAKLNMRLCELEETDARVTVIDLDRIVSRLGEPAALDRRNWFQFRAPLTPAALGGLAADLTRVIASRAGAVKKVVVVDCDQTLWGGLIGEDGMGGIALDPHDYPGNVYWTFQRQLLALQQRGLLLALCSRNEEQDVLAVLDAHPNCVLRREHLSGWRVNWDDKVTNLRSLADELHIGLDSVLFVDDNAFDCEMVREVLPMVEVLQVPERLSELPLLLRDHAGLPRRANTVEDNARSDAYQAERERQLSATSFHTIDEFLASLELTATVTRAEPVDVSRLAQLSQRTNQFNLSTRRYGPGDMERFLDDPAVLVMSLRLCDRHGDYGLTGLAILHKSDGTLALDALLLSCRVLGRRVEGVFLREALLAATARWGNGPVTAPYVRTAKNQQVEAFLVKHGFELAPGSSTPTTYTRANCFVRITDADHVEVVRDVVLS